MIIYNFEFLRFSSEHNIVNIIIYWIKFKKNLIQFKKKTEITFWFRLIIDNKEYEY